MNIKLVRISVEDTEKLWKMQVQAFQKLLDKYQDFDTNPANNIVGAIRVIDRRDGSRKRVAPVFIMERFRNRGLAQKAFYEIERIHGKGNWELDTIFQEKGNCYLYEKLGYTKTGEIDRINDKMDIIHYIKN